MEFPPQPVQTVVWELKVLTYQLFPSTFNHILQPSSVNSFFMVFSQLMMVMRCSEKSQQMNVLSNYINVNVIFLYLIFSQRKKLFFSLATQNKQGYVTVICFCFFFGFFWIKKYLLKLFFTINETDFTLFDVIKNNEALK